ncbi:MAG: hypothetical protein HYW34_01985 [Candidatus Brennerbacteria bacterium]|nr:hypothetical protein [Candidatus Brennerbacteria bacterium]
MLQIKRSPENPILLPDRNHFWEADAVFNPCPIIVGNKINLFYRAAASSENYDGFSIQISSIGQAVGSDGIHFKDRWQFIRPEYDWERYGCEDPRVTKFNGKYFIFYTALSKFPFSAEGIKIGVAVTKDFKHIEKHPVTPFNAKAMALFPVKIKGKIAAVLTVNTDQPPAKICLALFNKIEDIWSEDYWERWYGSLDKHVIVLQRSTNDHIEVGAPPVKTNKGWLLVYSYIKNYFSGPAVFGIEAALLDLKNPLKIIGRTNKPLLIPEEGYEQHGRVHNIVFPSGALVKNNKLMIYYGAADTSCCVASVGLKEFVNELISPSCSALVKRFSDNPIIKPAGEHPWEAKAVFNPGAVDLGGRIHLLYRAMSNDNTSVLGYASSPDGFHFNNRLAEPVYVPREDFEKKNQAGGNSGCEDPRLTVIGNKIYICYTAFNGVGPTRVALSSILINDFLAKRWNWAKPVLISPPDTDDKDAAIFPKKIKGKYAILHRLGFSIWIDFVDNLNFDGKSKWIKGRVLMNPRSGQSDSIKVGITAPPIETKNGWLLIYHGISRSDSHYRVRAALLDRSNPAVVLARTRDPIFEPETDYEKQGIVNNVVFPCGAILIKDQLFFYYGAADKVIAVATAKLGDILKLF